MRHFKEPARGYCPYLKRDHTIMIEYAEILLAGGQPPRKKEVDSSCDYSDECRHDNECPIFEEALEKNRRR